MGSPAVIILMGAGIIITVSSSLPHPSPSLLFSFSSSYLLPPPPHSPSLPSWLVAAGTFTEILPCAWYCCKQFQCNHSLNLPNSRTRKYYKAPILHMRKLKYRTFIQLAHVFSIVMVEPGVKPRQSTRVRTLGKYIPGANDDTQATKVATSGCALHPRNYLWIWTEGFLSLFQISF